MLLSSFISYSLQSNSKAAKTMIKQWTATLAFKSLVNLSFKKLGLDFPSEFFTLKLG